LTWEQFGLWIQYYTVEPFGEEREDYRIGTLIALTANINRDPKSKPDPFTPYDFMPYMRRPEAHESEEDIHHRQLEKWEAFVIESTAAAMARSKKVM